MQFAPLYPLLYRLLKPSFPNCLWSGSEDAEAIALTFDDGPHPEYTPQLLQVLDRYQIKASFFWLGYLVERYPTLAKEVSQRGHWIGLHGYDHQSFPFLKPNQIRESLLKTQTAIAHACHINLEQIRDVRPPNGLFTPQILQQLQRDRYRVVMWSVVPEDWVRPGTERVCHRVMTQVQKGSLIVLHDGYCGGIDVAQTTTHLIPRLLERGYDFATINQLWQQPNASFSSYLDIS